MQRSRIGWTDYSGGPLNFVRGCTPVSEGCAHCYARAIYERFGKDFSQVTVDDEALERLQTLSLPQDGNKRGPHSRPMAFVCDTGDMFHEDVPYAAQYEALFTMRARTDVTWIVLTKRPERMRDMLKDKQPLPAHIWLGVTCENQTRADERIPILLDTPAAVRFVSVEPMLEGWMHLERYLYPEWHPGRPGMGQPQPKDVIDEWKRSRKLRPGLDWVICGAESGPQRRPFDVAWAMSLYEQCKDARVPYFGKQASGLRPGEPLVLPGVGVVQEWPKEDR